MLEETAVVVRVDDGQTWIQSLQSDACGGCAQKMSCGTATMAKALPKREFAIACDVALQAGDQVVVAIDDGHLLRTALLLYLLPLLIMLAAVALAALCWPVADNWLPEIALVSLLASFWLLHRCQNRLLLHLSCQPQIVRKLANAEPGH